MITTSLPLLPVLDDDPSEAGSLGAPGLVLPLKSVDISTLITGLFTFTTYRQRFVNDTNEAIEVTYTFPLPGRSAVQSFTATLGGRSVKGRLLERGEARDVYDEALASGQRAAIAEEERPEIFSTRVGNLDAGEEAVIELTLIGSLAVENGEATFRFPLVVAPRYVAGSPIDTAVGDGTAPDTDLVPDASRVTPVRSPLACPALSLVVRIEPSDIVLTALASSLHATTSRQSLEGLTTIELQPGNALDRDFILRGKLDHNIPRAELMVCPDADGNEGTWALTVNPGLAAAPRAPRDVVIVLDRSGSMTGWKIAAARRAAARVVDSLDVQDTAAVVDFDTVVTTHQAGRAAATDKHRFELVRHLGNIEARGGTDLGAGLLTGMRLLQPQAGRQSCVILITDGQIAAEDSVLRSVAQMHGITVHCVGIGGAVNAGFLNRLADRTTGRCELVESEERLDEAMTQVQRLVNPPVMTGVGVRVSGVELIEGSSTPRSRLDVFERVPATMYGRYRGRAETARFELETASGAAPVVTTRVTQSRAVASLWAKAKIRELEDRYASGERTQTIGPEAVDLVEIIVGTSLRFEVLSRFTAFVAVDEEQLDIAAMRKVSQPVSAPSGWAAGGMASVNMVGASVIRGSIGMASSLGYSASRAFSTSYAPSNYESIGSSSQLDVPSQLAEWASISTGGHASRENVMGEARRCLEAALATFEWAREFDEAVSALQKRGALSVESAEELARLGYRYAMTRDPAVLEELRLALERLART